MDILVTIALSASVITSAVSVCLCIAVREHLSTIENMVSLEADALEELASAQKSSLAFLKRLQPRHEHSDDGK